jgi:hypothetical protein
MKITLNLSSAPSPRERYALVWAVPVALVALVGLGLLLSSSLTSWRNYRRYHGALAEAESQEARLRQRQLALEGELNQPEFSAIYRDTQFINSLIEYRQFSVAELTQKVTKLMPLSVHLAALALSHQGHERVVRFTVAGDKQDAIETFLVSLEDSPDFDQVQILNQAEEQTAAGGVQVVLTCTARYAGAERGPGDQ